MSGPEILYYAPDAASSRLVETALAALDAAPVKLKDSKELDGTSQAEACLIWPDADFWTAPGGAFYDPVFRSKTIFLKGESLLDSADLSGFSAVMDLPLRAGTLIDKLRQYFKSGPVYAAPEEIMLGAALFYPRELRFLAEKEGPAVALTEKERDILLVLYQAGTPGLERQALLDQVWAYAQGVETHTLETHIYRLRQKIEADPAAPKLLVNEDGVYKLAGI